MENGMKGMNALRAYSMENGEWRVSFEALANSPFSINWQLAVADAFLV
jgi:hypothetical protein